MFLSPFIVFSLILTGTALPVESAEELRELTSADFAESVKEGVWFVFIIQDRHYSCTRLDMIKPVS